MSRQELITCDHCGENMHHQEVDASDYGNDFHLECFLKMNAAQLYVHLSLGSVQVYPHKYSQPTNLASYLRMNHQEELNAGMEGAELDSPDAH